LLFDEPYAGSPIYHQRQDRRDPLDPLWYRTKRETRPSLLQINLLNGAG